MFLVNTKKKKGNINYVNRLTLILKVPILFHYILREKYPYLEFFWSVFSRIRTEFGEIQSISSYSVLMWENADQKNSEYWYFSRSDSYLFVWPGLFIAEIEIIITKQNQIGKSKKLTSEKKRMRHLFSSRYLTPQA